MTAKGDRTWYSESLARGLRVIQAFDRAAPRLRMAEVARRAGLTRAAARRYLLTLQDLGYVASEGDMFYLRPRLLSLGFSYLSSINVEELVQPVLNELAERTGASATFAVLDSHDVVSVARAPSKGIFMLANSIGGRLPAHATSLGHVLLAGLPADELERYLAQSRRAACTKSTTIDAARLRRRLQRVRADGLALVNGEYAEGLVAVAVPVGNAKGEVVAAINVNFYPASPAKVKLAKTHIAALRAAAREIETAIRTHAYFA
jgi:IclR family pca regulon transcriptional regulator